MKISKENVKTILFIALCIILMCVVVMRFDVVLGFVSVALSVVKPIIIGFCIAFVLNLLMSFIERKIFGFMLKPNKKGKTYKGFARLFSVLLTFVIFCGAIALLLFFIMPQVIETITAIISSIPAFTEKAIVFSKDYLERFNITSEQIREFLLNSQNLITTVGNFLKDNINTFLQSVTTFGTSLVSGIVSTLLGIFVAIYFLFDKEKLLIQMKRLFKAVLKPHVFEKVVHITHVSSKSFSNFISGQLMESLILGVLCFFGMLIFKIPYAPVVSVTIGVCALIPILGAWIGTAISFVLILIVNPVKALWFVVFIIVLQQIEGNLIYPRVVGKQVGLPGVWVLIAVVVGSGLMGAIGTLLAVPATSVVYTLVGEYVRKKENSDEQHA